MLATSASACLPSRFPNVGERLPLPVAQPDTAGDLFAEETILRHQVFVA